ncbi:MAG: hypothetical protein H6799_01440 [Candidatus Nomurabacteria bacterium]|nr:MAG: hypothetical protein H6799_01440 [Candidatus Nomurabacteria bacterium]
MSIKSFLLGLVITVYGVITLQYNYRYTNMFSRSAKIENWFGSMYTFFKLTSILAAIIGLLIAFGLGEAFVSLLVKPFQNSFGG